MSRDPLVLIGQLCNFAAQAHPDPDIAAHEGQGPIVVGEPAAIAAWSGLERVGRWKVKVLGPLAELPMVWNHVRPFQYHRDHASAVAHAAQVREVLLRAMPGTSLAPHPQFGAGSVPGASVEIVTGQNGQTAGVLMVDGEHDYDFALAMTGGVARIPAGNLDGPPVASWAPPACAAFLALGPGANGAPDHVVLAFTDAKADVRPLIAAGLEGASPDPQVREIAIDAPSGLLVALWGRVSGRALLGGAPDPAAAVAAALGQQVARPLDVAEAALASRSRGPMAWAIRVNPGSYTGRLFRSELDGGARLDALVLSRRGAGSFQVMQAGGAKGRVIAGLSLERYAELAAARDAIYLRATSGAGGAVGAALLGAAGGGAQAELDALCDRFGVPRAAYGMAGRVPEWEQAIQGDPQLSAEYAAFLAIANAKLQGIDPATLDLAGIRDRAQAAHGAVSQAAAAHASSSEKTLEGHYAVFEAARTRDADALLDWARANAYAHLPESDLAWAFGRANAHLHLYEDDACRVQDPRAILKSFLEATWKITPADEREGSLAGWVKEQSREIEEAYGIAAPSLLDRL